MIKKRQELEAIIDKIIKVNNTKKDIVNPLRNSLLEHNISIGEFQSIWNKNKTLDSIDDSTLFLLTKYLYELTSEENIKPETYFTETEIADGNNYKREIISDMIELPITFDEVIKVTDNQYITTLSIQKIKQLQDSKLISYNFDAQRNPKYKIDNEGELIKVANIKPQAVKEISDDMVSGKFIPNTITLNILQNGEEDFVFDAKSHELTITRGMINIIDGFHREMGLIDAIGQNSSLDFPMEVRITNWDIQKCRNFIRQESIRNKIDTKYLSSVINVDKWGNKVVNKLNEGQCDLKGKITTDAVVIRKNKAYTMFDLMSNTIDFLWDIKTNMDVNNLAKYLTEFFDYIIGYKVEDFIEFLPDSKEKSVVTYPAMFIGYLAIANKLEKDKNWQDKLREFLDNTDFDLNNPIWREIGIIDDNLSLILNIRKSGIKHIVNYFVTLIK